jgi:serine/threonine-protein kinase RsbW
MQSLTVLAVPESLAVISDFIVGAANRLGLDERTSWQLQLAVDEAATNIIQHGYEPNAPGMITVTWKVEAPLVTVTLHDTGKSFDPTNVPAPNLDSPLEERQEGGLGLYLMGQLMDHVHFTFDEKRGNLLTMSKQIELPLPIHEFELSGRLDAVTANRTVDHVRLAATIDRYVLLDLHNVTFLSSSGLRALLILRKELLARNGDLRLCGLQPQVREVFELTGFTQVFHIHTNRQEALAAFRTGAS